jgi:acylphosphatase
MSEHDDQRMAHWTMRVTGVVQGVNYRAEARREARRLGIAGSATNMPDGSVRIEAEGSVAALRRFRDWCATGPPGAEVGQIDVAEGELRGYTPGEFARR